MFQRRPQFRKANEELVRRDRVAGQLTSVEFFEDQRRSDLIVQFRDLLDIVFDQPSEASLPPLLEIDFDQFGCQQRS